ncbi:hypothetical protein ABEB36_012354 [Hypothenemus hampei]|uniref:Peptidase S1 domain-containing protein n=1 Tax=Hypothenemus hampei TaxID=57062 RepID=A0ABD1EF97_HYPHA
MYQLIYLIFLLIFNFPIDLCIETNTRIVGGNITDIKHLPYQVSIKYFGLHFCGGALITRNTVLSAAHCFTESLTSVSPFYAVSVGSNTTTGIVYQIKSVLVHPMYDPDTINYDISLLTLKNNVTLSETVSLIQISEKDSYTTGSLATVSGWGYEKENGTLSTLLRKVNVPVINRRDCKQLYQNMITITRYMICAGFYEGGKDACQGDSGGPLVQNNQLIGVVSFGMGCARRGYPGVYTNVANLVQWVKKNSNYQMNYGVKNFCVNRLLISTVMIMVYAMQVV